MVTSRHDALQVDDVGVVELAHNAGLAQEVPPLLLRVAHFERLDGDRHVPLAGQLEASAAHLAELSFRKKKKKKTRGRRNAPMDKSGRLQ